ncbi:MAG: DUF1549 domain-containing protein [Pirellulaceae bacterium]|nr:DUF1549 domain-containing protein [Pirellulaceae bacterium]
MPVFALAPPPEVRGELRDVIDQRVSAAWEANGISPAPLSSDGEFLRRVYLDLCGIIPTRDEAVAFLDDARPDKREQLIAKLLVDERYAIHQADVWDLMYFTRNPPGFGTEKRGGFQAWLRRQFGENRPYDKWVRDILRAEGNTVEDGPPMFLVQYKSRPADATEAVAQKFLGVQLQCARCHDHPFDDWTQQDFYGVAAFFARLSVVDVGSKNKEKAYAIGEKNSGDILFAGPATEQVPGKKGEAVAPRFLSGQALVEPLKPKDVTDPRNFPNGKMPPAPYYSRKNALADWVTSRENPYFARAAVNRVWAQFMGKGLVQPIDNLSGQNPPSHPELLAELADQFSQHDFDMRWLIGEIVNSKSYQRSPRGEVTEAMPLWYERSRVRPLSAEELFESWIRATDYLAAAGDDKNRERFRVKAVNWEYVRRFFGRPNDGVGNFQGGLHEHLYLNNGQVNALISRRPGGLHHLLANDSRPWEQRVERLFLQIVSRRPTAAETEKFVAYLDREDDADDRLQEAIWTLLTSAEFRFNH